MGWRWPLLRRGNVDQGPEAAREFVQGFLMARLEEAECACLWLELGVPAAQADLTMGCLYPMTERAAIYGLMVRALVQ